MSQYTIRFSDDQSCILEERAREAGLTPQEFLERTVSESLARPAPSFAAAAEYVLKKNAELYKRLA